MDKKSLHWGIDLGGTKIEGAVIQLGNGFKVLARERIPTESYLGYSHILKRIANIIKILENKTGDKPTKIGFGTPGTIDSETGLLKNSNTVCMIGKPVKQDLEKSLALQVHISNDANCFTLAETKLGVVKNLKKTPKTVFGVIMGTGVGGGLVINGHIINGLHGIGGEWGHNYLDNSGGTCYCGKTGCVETIISGIALEKFYFKNSGKRLNLKKIYERSEQGSDKIAVQTIKRLHHFFGKAISTVCNILDPEVIILGGGVGNITSLYTEGKKELAKYIFNDGKVKTSILRPKLGDSAGVFGAALL
ncbi:ROK family protein [Bacteroidota bacterium]